jgi:hypothetical protein
MNVILLFHKGGAMKQWIPICCHEGLQLYYKWNNWRSILKLSLGCFEDRGGGVGLCTAVYICPKRYEKFNAVTWNVSRFSFIAWNFNNNKKYRSNIECW